MKTMTKEIKFRGKDISNGSWRYGYYFSIKRNGRHFIKHPELFNDYEVDQSSVGQYIASNGKQDFYVGDIVVNPRGRKHTVVIWDNLPCLQYTDKGKVYFAPMTNGFLNNKTVIGNIYEKGGSK